MELKDRLKQSRKNAKLTQNEVVERIAGLSQSAYSQLESGKVKSSGKIVEIANLFNVSSTWLATGQGEPNEPSTTFDNNVEFIKPYGKIRKIPIFSDVPAGVFTEIGYNTYDDFEEIYDNGQYHERIFYLRINGDSMTPRFNTGDLILVDMDCQPKTGDFVVARTENNESTFKRLKIGFDEKQNMTYMQLIPLNEFYSVIDSRYQPFELIGKVIEKKEFF